MFFQLQGVLEAKRWSLGSAAGRDAEAACRWETWSTPQDRLRHEVEQTNQHKAADRADRSQQLDEWTEGNRQAGHKEFLKGRYDFVLNRPVLTTL